MNAAEFEDFVCLVVNRLDIARLGKVYRNRRYEGQRQPGHYEIDIAVELTLDEALAFLVVVECKNWSRPVDRPVIQKLVQTCDAISAHKAVVVSANGFTSEASAVAVNSGVALWTLGFGRLRVLVAHLGPSVSPYAFFQSHLDNLIVHLRTGLCSNSFSAGRVEWSRGDEAQGISDTQSGLSWLETPYTQLDLVQWSDGCYERSSLRPGECETWPVLAGGDYRELEALWTTSVLERREAPSVASILSDWTSATTAELSAAGSRRQHNKLCFERYSLATVHNGWIGGTSIPMRKRSSGQQRHHSQDSHTANVLRHRRSHNVPRAGYGRACALGA